MKYIHYSLLVLLLCSSLFFVSKGCLSDTDEFPVIKIIEDPQLILHPIQLVKYSVNSSLPIFETFIRNIQYAIINLISVLLGINLSSEGYLKGFVFFNVITHAGIISVLYLIFINLKFDKWLALTGVFIYVSLLNTNLYICHLLSYDESLLFYLFALYFLTKRNSLSYKNILFSGILMAFAWYSYYGYFVFFIGLCIYTFWSAKGLNQKLWKSTVLVIPYFIFLILFEFISKAGGFSYLHEVFMFAQSIIQGSYREVLVFGLKYFIKVEKVWGGVIFIGSFIGIVYLFLNKHNFNPKVVKVLTIGIVMYLFYSILALSTQDFVMYGRLLHMYYPFVILAFMLLLTTNNRLKIIAMIFSLVNFIYVVWQFNNIDYPRDVLHRYSYIQNTNNCYVNESLCGIEINETNDRFVNISNKLAPSEIQYLLVNFCFFYHHPNSFIESYTKYIPKENEALIFEKNHFMSFPAYTFEYCDPIGRNYFIKNNFKIKVYQRNI